MEYSVDEKKNFAIALMRVYQILNEYGKQGQDFDVIVEGFLFYIERKQYVMKQVIDALFTHIERSKVVPTPFDIENIINPPLPKIDWPFYIELKKRMRDGNVYVDQDEKKFIQNCEDLAMLRQRGEMENYNDAQRQLTHWQQLKINDYSEN